MAMAQSIKSSLTESKFADTGIDDRRYFRENPSGQKMVDYISEQMNQGVHSIYSLDYNRSQATAFVSFLINAQIVVRFEYIPEEIPEHIKKMLKQEDLEPFEQMPLKEYKRGLKRQDQIKLNALLKLAHEDMGEEYHEV